MAAEEQSVLKSGRFRYLAILKYLFLFIAILIISYYLVQNWHEVRTLESPSIPWICIHFVIIPVQFLINGIIQYSMLKHFGLILPFKEWFGLSVMNIFMNYAVPVQGGLGFRSLYLKLKHNFELTLFVSMLAVLNVINVSLNAITGLLLTVILRDHVEAQHLPVLLGVFGIPLVGIGCVVLIVPFIPEFKWKYLRRINRWKEGWNSLRSNKKLMMLLAGLNIISMMSGAVVLYTAFRVVNVAVPFPEAVVMNNFMSYSIFFNITPGAIGVNEGIVAYAAASFGYTASFGLIASIVRRFGIIVWTLVLGSYFSLTMFRLSKPE